MFSPERNDEFSKFRINGLRLGCVCVCGVPLTLTLVLEILDMKAVKINYMQRPEITQTQNDECDKMDNGRN